MLLREYKETHTWDAVSRLGKPFKKVSHQTKLELQCDNCSEIFIRNRNGRKWFTTVKKHYCLQCLKNCKGSIALDNQRRDPYEKGTVRIGKSKYPYVFAGYDYPYSNRAGWVREHTYVMQNVIQSDVPSGMIVHHIDGDKLNNVIENLVLMTVEDHNRCHARSEGLIFKLVKMGLVFFNRDTLEYEMTIG